MKHSQTIIRRVLLTEKGAALQETGNQYLFQVTPSANKIEIKAAVEELFQVHVTGVRTMNRQGKKKRLRTQKYGRTAAWKRAVVSLRAGETIELV